MADYWQEWVSFRLDFDDSDNTFVWAMMTTMVTMTVIIGAAELLCGGTCITDHIWLLASKPVVAKQRQTSVWHKDIKNMKNVSKTIWLCRCYGAKSSIASEAKSLAWFSLVLFFSTLWPEIRPQYIDKNCNDQIYISAQIIISLRAERGSLTKLQWLHGSASPLSPSIMQSLLFYFVTAIQLLPFNLKLSPFSEDNMSDFKKLHSPPPKSFSGHIFLTMWYQWKQVD